MSEHTQWRSIDTAPQDGTVIIVRAGEDCFLAAWIDGFTASDDSDVACWVAMSDGFWPADWTSGVCWLSNEDGVPSAPPSHWRAADAPSL